MDRDTRPELLEFSGFRGTKSVAGPRPVGDGCNPTAGDWLHKVWGTSPGWVPNGRVGAVKWCSDNGVARQVGVRERYHVTLPPKMALMPGWFTPEPWIR